MRVWPPALEIFYIKNVKNIRQLVINFLVKCLKIFDKKKFSEDGVNYEKKESTELVIERETDSICLRWQK